MAARTTRFTNDAAVRIFLGAQGLAAGRPIGRVDSRHFSKLISRLRLLQIDSVNVVARAHYMPAFARLGNYDRDALDRWIYDGRNMFEYWCHEQSYAPMSFYAMMRPRMEALVDHPWKRIQELRRDGPDYIQAVLDEVQNHGPIPNRHLSDPGERTGPWWGYGKGKIALEWLFATGQITVNRRINFERFYDMPERVLPPEALAAPALTPVEADRARIRESAVALGIGTVADLADFFRMKKVDTAAAVAWLIERGELQEVTVDGWDKPAYVRPDVIVPRARRGTALIAPFDALVWDRVRTERMFDFHYRIEIYTPAPKRVYGYYVLPFLVAGELVGRVDAKADRHERVLRIPGAFAEDDVDIPRVARALAQELRTMAAWLRLDNVQIGRRGNLAAATRKAM